MTFSNKLEEKELIEMEQIELQRIMIDFGPVLNGYYQSLVLQFSYIVLFGAFFPLGTFVLLLSNILMILLTAYAYSHFVKRSLAEESEGIGVWIYLIEVMSYLAVIYNGALLIFPAKGFVNIFGERDSTRDLMFILIGEHVLVCFKAFLGRMITDEPSWVTYLRNKE